MDGLDRIIEKILSDGKKQENLILSENKQKCAKILSEAEINAAEKYEKVLADAKRKAASEIERARSAALRQSAETVLKVKNDEIDRVIKKAVEELKKMPCEEYFSVITRLVQKYCRHGSHAVMLFGENDLKRMPEGFEEKLNNAVKSKSAVITVSENSAGIESGFILEYGKVSWNCSFDALAEENSFAVRDEIHRILFP